jgi:hypothetical protein
MRSSTEPPEEFWAAMTVRVSEVARNAIAKI